MPVVTVRLAGESDAEILRIFNEEFNGVGDVTAESVRESLRTSSEIVGVVEVDGTPVGFCCGQITRSFCYRESTAELTELYIREPYRRTGCASALLRFMEAICRETYHAESIRLLTGEDNCPARHLYESLGYTAEDEVLYTK